MKPEDFETYNALLKSKSGLVLTPDKTYLLESRLSPVAKQWDFDSLDAMSTALKGRPDPKLVNDIVEAMTTNETSFFRDMRPFDMFRDFMMAYMKDARTTQKKLRIWCAAASSGQEPYTIAMILKEAEAQYPGWTFEIIATDISHDILTLAGAGIYSQFEVQRGLPIQLLMKYFTQAEDKWQINDVLKNMITYKYFNLLDPMTSLGSFDIIFCRNVLIYFDETTKGDVLNRMSRQLEPDGFLLLGGAETVLGITDSFSPVPNQRGAYARPGSPHLETAAPAAAGTTTPPTTPPAGAPPAGTPPLTSTQTGTV